MQDMKIGMEEVRLFIHFDAFKTWKIVTYRRHV